ncbi:MAG: hypothetical protein WA666_03490 [Nitrospirota bacterium]
MKKLIVALGLIAVLVPAAAYSEQGKIAGFVDKILGRGKGEAATEQPGASKKKIKYVIRLRNGGKIDTDNYEILKNSVRIMLPAGAILIQKSEIRDIQEVASDEVTVQKNFPPPGKETAGQNAPSGGSEHLIPTPTPGPAPSYSETTDDNGHDQYWWKRRVEEWNKKYDDAATKYKEANDDWNRYNGLLLGIGGGAGASQANPSVSNYQVTQYQDLRGSARVRMDEAQSQMDEADNMLHQVIPEEARKAGAPPGWVR